MTSPMELAGRVAIVTGAGKGMGPAIAETLAREGADLMLGGRDLAALEKVSAGLRNIGRRAYVARCDICKAEEVAAMVAQSLQMLGGRIDILVNGAGGTGPVERSTLETMPQEFDEVVAVNMRGVYLTMRAVLPTMIAQRYGKIVNVGGSWGLRGRALRMAEMGPARDHQKLCARGRPLQHQRQQRVSWNCRRAASREYLPYQVGTVGKEHRAGAGRIGG